jgi:hypothetical protein
MRKIRLFTLFLMFSLMFLANPFAAQCWESQLFPKDGDHYKFATVSGFKLPDFSYAGYHGGEQPIPNVAVKKEIAPIGGDNANHIQTALNQAVGGALLLKPGTYRVRSQIVIPANTVLRGSGSDKTFIHVDRADTKQMSFIVGNSSKRTSPSMRTWGSGSGTKRNIVADVEKGSVKIQLQSAAGLSPDDWIVIRNQVTDAFRKVYNGTTDYWPSDDVSSLKYLRKIANIDGNTITIDHPVTHILKRRDNPYVMTIGYMAEEIGVEDLSIGFSTPADYPKYHEAPFNRYVGSKAAYHAARAICFGNVVNGWIKNVRSYSPDNNGVHLHSRGIVLRSSKWITVKDCYMAHPAHRGGGGNGYLYVIKMSNNCLLINCTAHAGRTNFLFHDTSSGNVISGGESIKSFFANNPHHSLSNANLIENMQITSEYDKKRVWDIANRGTMSGGAGYTGTDNVFWRINIISPGYKIRSEQASANNGKGYVIGATAVDGSTGTQGSEWREGIGQEASLSPVSLYQEQLNLRLGTQRGVLSPPKNFRLASEY